MPQAKADKTFFEFTGGINTEVSPLAFPDGVSLDEENFELMPDGTRRRRRGLRLEEGGSSLDVSSLGLTVDDAFSYHRWQNVAGDPDVQIIVVQMGNTLMFFTDGENLSTEEIGQRIDLVGFRTGDFNPALLAQSTVTFSDGLGYLLVAGPHIEPLVISYDALGDEISVETIPMRIRDFKGLEDGLAIMTQPATLSASHRYNLLNRGWLEDNITQYFTDTGGYPAKNQIPWFGYRRATATGYADEDGDKEWNSTKLEAEVFGNSSAPQGALYLNPFDTANSAQDGLVGNLDIVTWSKVDGGVYPDISWVVTLEVTAHGLSPGDTFVISGNQYKYTTSFGANVTSSLNGTYEVFGSADADHISFIYHGNNPNLTIFTDQYFSLGQISLASVPKPGGVVTDARPRAVAWHASRAFWAGVNDAEYNDTIFFSQIVTRQTQFGYCIQENDPTAEHLNVILPTDGGTIQVPGMGGVIRMVPFGSALYVFSTLGVWEIGPGQGGFFSADGYSVRKVSDIEATAVLGIVSGDFGIVFTSPRGIYALVQDANSGFVVPQSLSEGKIQTLWNAIPKTKQGHVQCLFDSALKRYYIFYSDDLEASQCELTKAVVFDVVRGAFYKLKFPNDSQRIFGVLTTSFGDATDEHKKLKALVATEDMESVDVSDMEHSNWIDYNGGEQIPYLLTGYDNVGDFQRRRQAPVCHVFLKKTETGFVEVGDDLNPVGESSVYLQARWDWADKSVSGKFSPAQQVYRHIRTYTPVDINDTYDDGHPIIVTRTKLRGRGRALHLKFYGEEGKDAHLVGWALQYAGTARE